MNNEHELVEDVNAQSLIKLAKLEDVDAQSFIKLAKFLKRGKDPGLNTTHNEVLMLGTTTSLFHHLAKLFTSAIQLGYIPTAWKIATLHVTEA